MPDTHRDELIVQYLDGTLLPDQHARVAARLLTDKEWQAAHERLNLAMASVQYYGIRQQVAAVHQQFLQQHTQQQSRAGLVRTLRIITAGAATILFFFISYKAYQFYMLSNEKIYQEMYISYTVPVTRDEQRFLTPLAGAYAQQQFRSVDSLRKKTRKLSREEQLLSGIAALELQDYTTAIRQLQPLASGETVTIRDDAQFYLTLAWIKNGDYDLAIEMMERIHSDTAHRYHRRISPGDIRDVRMLKWK